MVGFLPQSTEAFTSGCPFSIDAPSSVEALFRRKSMPPTSSATFGCRIRFVCLSTCNKQARKSKRAPDGFAIGNGSTETTLRGSNAVVSRTFKHPDQARSDRQYRF